MAKSAPPQGFVIDADLKAFVESGVAVLVASGDAERRPHVVYAWGPRVRDGGVTVDVFLDTLRASQTLSNLRENPRIAMTVADPVSVRSVQFKGTFVEEEIVTDADQAWVQRQREAFVVSTSLVGDPPEIHRGMWLDDLTRVTFAVECAFDQTPGPNAGKPL